MTISKYTKHYYASTGLSTSIGSERVASALGSIKSLGLLCEIYGADANLIETMNNKVEITEEFIAKVYDTFKKDLELTAPYLYGTEYLRCDLTHYQDMYHPYWYHPDHLGSSSYITNLDGEINQHLEYLPFGEALVEEHLSSYNSPFKFNAKELDAETGWYYYGARYYSQKYNLMLSVDQMYDLYPSFSPYAYTLQNPIKFTDPTGMTPENAGGGCPEGHDCPPPVFDFDSLEHGNRASYAKPTNENVNVTPETHNNKFTVKALTYVDVAGQNASDIEISSSLYAETGFWDYKIQTGTSLSVGSGLGVDVEVFAATVGKVNFNKNLSAESMADAFNQAPLINSESVSAVIKYSRLRAYESPQTMNPNNPPVWSSNTLGGGVVTAGISGSRSMNVFSPMPMSTRDSIRRAVHDPTIPGRNEFLQNKGISNDSIQSLRTNPWW